MKIPFFQIEKPEPIVAGAPEKRTIKASDTLPKLDSIDPSDLASYPTSDDLFRAHLSSGLKEQRYHAGNLRKAYENEDGTPTGKITPGNFVRICRLIKEVKSLGKKYPDIQKFLYDYMGMGEEKFIRHNKTPLSPLEISFLRSIMSWKIMGVIDSAILDAIKQDILLKPEEVSEEDNIALIQEHYQLSDFEIPKRQGFSIKKQMPAHLIGLLPSDQIAYIFEHTRNTRSKLQKPDGKVISKGQEAILQTVIRARGLTSDLLESESK